MSRRAWLVIGGAVVLVAAGLGAWTWSRAEPGGELRTGTYTATVRGTNVDGAPFEARGELVVSAPGQELPYKWCLKVGLPAGDPKPGAIWFGSHGACFGAGRVSPVITWRRSGAEHVLVPLNPPPSVRESLNSFYATSVPMAEANQPDGGAVRFRADGDTLTGTIDLTGVAMGNAKRGAYTATFTAYRS
ncbi:hypothetical protein [Luedemannella helvata]|uniref:Uncharacterized protein n=1 Tax=Luedemannella helvata TaxID=349315 RepID=A0ABP4WWJ4_9ACTN